MIILSHNPDIREVEKIWRGVNMTNIHDKAWWRRECGMWWGRLGEPMPSLHLKLIIFSSKIPHSDKFGQSCNHKMWTLTLAFLIFTGQGHTSDVVVYGESSQKFESRLKLHYIFLYLASSKTLSWVKIGHPWWNGLQDVIIRYHTDRKWRVWYPWFGNGTVLPWASKDHQS